MIFNTMAGKILGVAYFSSAGLPCAEHGDFVKNRLRDSDRAVQLRQQIKLSDGSEVDNGQGIADDFQETRPNFFSVATSCSNSGIP